jgi:hypothetical protein
MGRVESLPAMLERKLIQGIVLEIMRAETEYERARPKATLIDLIEHADPSLDPTLLDSWAQAYLKHNGLYVWPEHPDRTYRQPPDQMRSSVAPDPKASNYCSDTTPERR